MTPAVSALEASGEPFQLLTYEPAAESVDIGLAAARALGLDPALVFKTLIAQLNTGALVVAILPVGEKLNMKRLARAAGAKSAALAPTAQAERTTGFVTGGISPIGQKKTLPTFLDSQSQGLETIYVSAGKRGLELALGPESLMRISGATLVALTG